MNTITKAVLINDCCLLFDNKIIDYVDFINTLSYRILRSAYRKKAFATHPDRSQVLGLKREKLDQRFKEISTAYKRLNSIILSGKKYIIKDQ